MIFRYVSQPVDNLLGQEATTERREALIESLGLNGTAGSTLGL